MESEEEKYIMTILGPKSMGPEDICLPYEHLTSDLSSANIDHSDDKLPREDLKLEFKNLSRLRKYPYNSLENCVQSDTVYTLGHELLYAADFGVKFVIDTTPKIFGKDWEKLQKVTEEVGDKISIITGCSGLADSTLDVLARKKINLTSEQFDLQVQKCINDFTFELNTGYSGLKAGFIGEIVILNLNQIEKARLKAAITVSKEIGVPVFLSIDDNSEILPDLIDYIIKDLDYDSEKVIIQMSKLDSSFISSTSQATVGSSSLASPASHHTSPWNLLSKTRFSICFTQYSRGLSYIAGHWVADNFGLEEGKSEDEKLGVGKKMNATSTCRPPQNYQIRSNLPSIYSFLQEIKLDDPILERLLVSTGISFKSQLLQFGGDGYSSVFEGITQDKYASPIDERIISQIFNENPKRIFSYWTKPPVEEVEIPMFTCRWCDDEFLDDGSRPKFEKFENTYCSMKCLADHRKFGFE
ncbi:unnamed protein product [Moneuplotes crassus]|uniref:Vms1-associating treble clef domain-containing protein n=1 Tax=Euplotes crassus TaxID=5936 RepID=A0AAD1UD50_EUPCR|nr:unnamed protein product [Moneuplotes crassus]